MLVVRDAMIAEGRNSRVGDGLPKKIEIGEARHGGGGAFLQAGHPEQGGRGSWRESEDPSILILLVQVWFQFVLFLPFWTSCPLFLVICGLLWHLKTTRAFLFLFFIFECSECRFITAFDFLRSCLCFLLVPLKPLPLTSMEWDESWQLSFYICVHALFFSTHIFLSSFYFLKRWMSFLILVIWAEALTRKLKSIP